MLQSFPNLILIGMMGAGKTTLGRELARRYSLRFVDGDHEIEVHTGVTIPTIFEIEGEDGFRRRETQVLQEITLEQGIVLATGGGVVLRPENRPLLRERGLVIYLSVSPEQLWIRLHHDRTRPLLQVENPEARIQALFKQRDPLYREVAHLIVDCDSGTPITTARQIEKELERVCGLQ